MKRKKLIIKDHGLYLTIPGLIPFRTPAKVDITKVGETIVLAELRKNGITNFKIVETEDIISTQKLKNKQEEKIVKNNDSLEDLKNSINNIELLLRELLNRNSNVKDPSTEKIEALLNDFLLSNNKKVEKDKLIVKKSKVDEYVDDFIPEINIDKIKIKGSTAAEKVIKSEEDILKSVESLKTIKRS